MRKTFLSLTVLCVSSLWAQQFLSDGAILKMHAAGLSDDLLVSSTSIQPGIYATSVNSLIALKAGLGDRIVGTMIAKTAGFMAAPIAPAGGPTAPPTAAPDPNAKPRVFLESSSTGGKQNYQGDQSLEMSKDFEHDCPDVRISLNQTLADYTVFLHHIEQVFMQDQYQIASKDGDLISTIKEGGSIAGGVKKACTFILTDWATKTH